MVKNVACTNPRGNLWCKDTNNVAYRMMLNMGWSAGSGLGAKEEGMKEAIKVRPKNDFKGVGFHQNFDNNWLEHQEEFNALLSSLNQNVVVAPTEMMSLEAKSKNLQHRLRHYHKYTCGKDLSSSSDHDLACIFGKRRYGFGSEEQDKSNIVSKMSSREYFSQKQAGQQSCSIVDNNNHFKEKACVLQQISEQRFSKESERMKKSCEDSEKPPDIEIESQIIIADEMEDAKLIKRKAKKLDKADKKLQLCKETSEEKEESSPTIGLKRKDDEHAKESKSERKLKKRSSKDIQKQPLAEMNVDVKDTTVQEKQKENEVNETAQNEEISLRDAVELDRKSNKKKKNHKRKKEQIENPPNLDNDETDRKRSKKDKRNSKKHTFEDAEMIQKRFFALQFLAKYRNCDTSNPTENFQNVLDEFMKEEKFVGSNFFSIQGYPE